MLAMLDMLQNVVLPSIPALIFFVLEVSPAPSHCCFNLLFTGLVRVGLKIPQDGPEVFFSQATWFI